MKTFLCLALVLGGLTASAAAQVPVPVAPHPHSLSLSVEAISTGGSSQFEAGTKNSKTMAGTTSTSSYRTKQTETTKEHEAIQITVRNFGQLPDTAQVEWYFVAGPAKPDLHTPLDSQQFIFDKGSKSITIAPGGTQAFPVNSSEITSELKRQAQTRYGKGKKGKEEETGSVLDGWMVRITADGKTLGSSASKDQLGEIVKDDAKLKSMGSH